MMFGAPSHRLEAQIQNTGRVLDLQVSCMYLPGVMLISFGDSETHTSETRFVKQAPSLDLGKLKVAHEIYWKVIHDEISVVDAQESLDELMKKPPAYQGIISVIIGGLCSSAITPLAFRGSFVDALSAFPLGCLLVWMQNVVSTNDLFSNVFEILIATLVSFLSAALGSTTRLCYTAIASGSVVLILPGYIVLAGSLEIASRNITSGAVRLGYSIIYSLFLGFGLSIGAEIYHQISGKPVLGADDYFCAATHRSDGPWWQRNVSEYWAFLLVPMYSLVLSLRNQQPVKAKELPIMVLMSCAGWTVNHFASKQFVNRNDITSAFGSFVVGVLGNLYGRFFFGNAFVIMLTGILFQLPSGLSNGGLLSFASQTASGDSASYSTGFAVAEQLVSVAIGLTVGLFASAVVVHPFGGSKRRGAGLFSL
ncbi:hypothetical protein FRC02_010567 [Tulasnella sp. 418]|nr:hypothetical protein FRC02_010567 [Tulasnella sp. 418]